MAATALVIAIGTVWGLFLAPRRRFEIGDGRRLALETVLFAGVGAGLAISGQPIPAVIGVVLWVLDRIALAVLPASND